MTANVTILTAKMDDTMRVPNSVLRFRPSAAVLKKVGLPAIPADKQQIYLLVGGKLKVAPVKLGLSDGKYTAIISTQIQPGAQVVVRATLNGSPPSSSSTTSAPMGLRM